MEIFRYSALDTAHRCLTKYKLQYLDKLQVPGLPSIDLEFGTAMHAALNACLEGEEPIPVFNAYWDTLRGTQFVSSRDDWGSLQGMGEVFLTRFQRLHAKNFKPVLMEQKLSGNIGGHDIEGTPDFIGEYKGVPSVLDFKTSGYAYPKEKIIINEQMPIYAELARQQIKYEVQQRVYVVFVKGEQRIQVLTAPLSKEELDNHLKNVILMCNELKARTVFPKNPSSCMMGKYKCAYFDKCHGGSDGAS